MIDGKINWWLDRRMDTVKMTFSNRLSDERTDGRMDDRTNGLTDPTYWM